MIEFNSSLLRERFIIKDGHHPDDGEDRTMIALSNRMVLELKNDNGDLVEVFIIRAHNMHTCIRICARLIEVFQQTGPIIHREKPFNWGSAWEYVLNEYEKSYNPELWIAVYNEGKLAFEVGDHHPFLDMIEKCESQNDGQYEYSLSIAEDSFRNAGKDLSIDYDGNVAMVTDFDPDIGKCAFILRHPDRTRTFSFKILREDKERINIPKCLNAGAALLEGIQLAFMVGMNNEKIHLEKIDRHSDEAKQTAAARKRLGLLNAEITNLENGYAVHYRPERPDLQEIVEDAEDKAHKIFNR